MANFFLVLYFLIIFSCLKTFGTIQWHPSLAIQECPEPLLVNGYTGLSKTGYPTFFRDMHHIMFIHFLIKHSYFCGYPPFCGYLRSRPSTWRKWFGGLSRAVCIVLWWKQFARYRSYEIRTVPVRLGVSIVMGVPEELDGSEKSWKIPSKWMIWGVPLYFRKLSYVGLMIIDMHILGINTIHQLESLRIPNTGVKSSTSRVTFAGQLCHRVVRTSCLVMSTWLRSLENISIALSMGVFRNWRTHQFANTLCLPYCWSSEGPCTTIGSLPEGSSGVFERRLVPRRPRSELLWGGCLKRDKGFSGSCWNSMDSLATLGGAVRPVRGFKNWPGRQRKQHLAKARAILCVLTESLKYWRHGVFSGPVSKDSLHSAPRDMKSCRGFASLIHPKRCFAKASSRLGSVVSLSALKANQFWAVQSLLLLKTHSFALWPLKKVCFVTWCSMRYGERESLGLYRNDLDLSDTKMHVTHVYYFMPFRVPENRP